MDMHQRVMAKNSRRGRVLKRRAITRAQVGMISLISTLAMLHGCAKRYFAPTLNGTPIRRNPELPRKKVKRLSPRDIRLLEREANPTQRTNNCERDSMAPLVPLVNHVYYEAFDRDLPPELGYTSLPRELMGIIDVGGFHIPGIDTLFLSGQVSPIEGLRITLHEIGHGVDILIYGKWPSEFTAEFTELYLGVLAERSTPVIVHNGDKRVMREYNFIHGSKLERDWRNFRAIQEGSREQHALGRINALVQLATMGSFKAALKKILETPVEELAKEASKPRTEQEFHDIIAKCLDIIERELLGGPFGEKLIPLEAIDCPCVLRTDDGRRVPVPNHVFREINSPEDEEKIPREVSLIKTKIRSLRWKNDLKIWKPGDKRPSVCALPCTIKWVVNERCSN